MALRRIAPTPPSLMTPPATAPLQMAKSKRTPPPPTPSLSAKSKRAPPPPPTTTSSLPVAASTRSKRKAVTVAVPPPATAMGAAVTTPASISPAPKKQRLVRAIGKSVPFPSMPEVIELLDDDDDDDDTDTAPKRTVKPDIHIPVGYGNDLQVIQHDGDSLDIAMARACLYQNQNEFVLLQALENPKREFFVWMRSGIVGTVGTVTMEGPWRSKQEALDKFRSVFMSKTLLEWRHRHSQRFGEGGYTWFETHQLTRDDEVLGGNAKAKRKPSKSARARGLTPRQAANQLVTEIRVARTAMPASTSIPPSTLDEQVQSFLSMIMDAASVYSTYDNKFYTYTKRTKQQNKTPQTQDENEDIVVHLPLGKLSKATIERGFQTLHRLHDALTCNADRTTLTHLSGRFYSVIPHPQLTLLDSVVRLTEKVEMLVALCINSGHHELLLPDLRSRYFSTNSMDMAYTALGCRLFPLQSSSREFLLVRDYIFNSFCCVGSISGAHEKLVTVFRVEKPDEATRFSSYRNAENRRILWHGSRMSNWMSILKHGLLITPAGVQLNGSSLGPGLYFTDKISKAMAYSHASHGHQVFLLSEVALGKCRPSAASSRHAIAASNAVHSCHGVGRCIPDAAGDFVDAFGAIWPLGKATQTTDSQATHGHSEFVVYNTAQARMRYIVVTHPLY